MKTKAKTAIATPTHHIIGLDIGYGVTKVVTAYGDSLTLPSVAGHAHEIKFRADEVAQKYPGDMLTDDVGDWFIGELALSQLRSGAIMRLRGRTADEQALGNVHRIRMMKAALGKLFPNKMNGEALHITIATGLPVDHMRDAEKLKLMMIGQHLIQTDQTCFVANISDVAIMPQPYGTIYQQMLTERGEMDDCYIWNRTGVVDVGTYTVDATLDADGEYIDVSSGSAEAGVYLVQDAIAAAYERDYRAKPKHSVVEHVLRTGCLKVRGEPVSYMEVVKDATRPLIDATLNLMGEKWQGAEDIDVIWLSGGGAALVADEVKRIYPQARLVNDFQIANARGYLNYAMFQASNG